MWVGVSLAYLARALCRLSWAIIRNFGNKICYNLKPHFSFDFVDSSSLPICFCTEAAGRSPRDEAEGHVRDGGCHHVGASSQTSGCTLYRRAPLGPIGCLGLEVQRMRGCEDMTCEKRGNISFHIKNFAPRFECIPRRLEASSVPAAMCFWRSVVPCSPAEMKPMCP